MSAHQLLNQVGTAGAHPCRSSASLPQPAGARLRCRCSAARPEQRIAFKACLQSLPAAAAAAAALLSPAPASAANLIGQVAEGGSVSLALGGGAAIAVLGATLMATDPEKRRSEMTAQADGDEKASVKSYFNTTGFERWNKIYGDTDDVNKVQLDIRTGHAQTVEKVLGWLQEEGGVAGTSVCDCGCGTGSLAIPLALRGAAVNASDISDSMAAEARRRYEAEVAAGASAPATAPIFEAADLESVSGRYHTVTCLDVMIHYPQNKADAMITHLASLAEKRLIISFAPYTPYYAVLKRIGELFPGPTKATRAYLHAEADVEAALSRAGFAVTKREMTATSFYFSRLLEAQRL